MGKKTLRIVVDVDLGELPDNERKECAKLDGCEPSELPSLDDASAFELAECLCGSFDNEETWGGSGIYCKVAGVKIVSQEFVKGEVKK